MLKAPCSSQLKVWQKGVAFKTSFSFDRNCTIFPDYLLQFAQERKESTRIEMSPTAIQSKAWGWCLSPPAKGRKCWTFSFLAFLPLPGRTEFCWTYTYHNLVCDTVGWGYTWKPSQPHRVLADRCSPLQASGELRGVWRLNKTSWPKNWEVPQKPGDTFVPFM